MHPSSLEHGPPPTLAVGSLFSIPLASPSYWHTWYMYNDTIHSLFDLHIILMCPAEALTEQDTVILHHTQ
jgi:hypothetical protein